VTTTSLQRSTPATAENVTTIRRAVCDLARSSGAGERSVGDVVLGVAEACGNVVLHAYVNADVGPLIVDARVGGEELVVIVTDQGRGCVPRPDSGGMGLGLPMMTTLARSVSITAGPGGAGTEVRMVFALAAD